MSMELKEKFLTSSGGGRESWSLLVYANLSSRSNLVSLKFFPFEF